MSYLLPNRFPHYVGTAIILLPSDTKLLIAPYIIEFGLVKDQRCHRTCGVTIYTLTTLLSLFPFLRVHGPHGFLLVYIVFSLSCSLAFDAGTVVLVHIMFVLDSMRVTPVSVVSV